MNKITMALKVTELKELKAERDRLNTQIQEIEDEIKAEMTKKGKYEFSGEGWKVTWNTVTSNRFDQAVFKEAHPKLFERYKVVSESRRFNLY